MTDAPTDQPLVLLDATSMLFRAFYAAPPHQTPAGVEVGALHAFTQMVLKLVRKASTRTFGVVFDPGGPTFRHELSSDYKAKRKAQPPEFTSQADNAVAVCRALGLMTWRVDGFEADDVIATLTRQARTEGLRVWVVSPDKDLFQLVDDAPPQVCIWRMAKREIVDGAKVEELLGVPPSRALTYFSLVGDTSDNVEGVRGVGPKAAVSIVKRFATLDDIYANLVRMWALPVRGASTLGDKLKAAREAAYLAESLIRLRDDVPLPLDAPLSVSARWRGPRADAEETLYPLAMGNLLTHARRLPV